MRLALIQYLVNQAVFHGFSTTHEIVAVSVERNSFHRLPSMSRQNAVEAFAYQQNLTRMNVNVAGLTLEAAQGLVNHDARMWEAIAFAFAAAGKQ